MAGNSFGTLFRITTAGESHGPGNTVIIDGCPAGLALEPADIQPDLDRRRPGQSKITTQRQEADQVQILSGVFEGRTTGTALCLYVPNEDQRSKDYSNIKDLYRPGHADHSFDAKYGFRDYRGGGRSSARETVARVAAGAVARKLLRSRGIEVVGYVKQVGSIVADVSDPAAVTLDQVEANIVRCPDAQAAEAMIQLIDQVRLDQDSIGGKAEIVVTGVPAGWGEPVFDKLKADFAKALLSIPGVMAFEYGNGVEVASQYGSQNNDIFINKSGRIGTRTNRHGGMLGGISSGEPILLRASIKPTSSLSRSQETVTRAGEPASIQTRGRHDPCLLPRFIPMGEAMVLLTLADHWLRSTTSQLDRIP
ncbi:MAG: chorismate synthase [Acidobacteria bacterium]|nr:chorismate synthase [Acidobacteriota bacterium]MCB9399687.1 chorismate synthase [Acidobacteriota bacterium]